MADDTSIFVHPNAIVEPGASIGERTRIWAFAHVLPGAGIGTDCNICDGVFVENDVIVGDRVTVKCGVQLWDGIRLEDDVFVGPNATFTNDPFPRSKQHLNPYPNTIVRKGASIGANATILSGIEIGSNAMVGAGAVVTRNVPQNAIVHGNPARIEGYVSLATNKPVTPSNISLEAAFNPTRVPRVAIYKLPRVSDLRGELVFGEYDKHLPFVPKRYFVIYAVPSKEIRGDHAHIKTHQFLVCLQGTVNVVVDDGCVQDEIILNDANMGLHIPPLIWAVQYRYSPDAVLLVLASEVYDAQDYIRSYDDYLGYVRAGNGR